MLSGSPSIRRARQLPEESDSDSDVPVDDPWEDADFDDLWVRYGEVSAQATEFLSEEELAEVQPDVSIEHISSEQDGAALLVVIRKIESALEAKEAEAGGEEEEDEEEEEEEEEEAEDNPLEPEMVGERADALEALTDTMTLLDITEQNITQYSSVVYGVPDDNIVQRGEPMEFANAQGMNAMLNTKSPPLWDKVRTRHIWVVRNNSKRKPAGWWDGKPEAPTLAELPYETFFYICCFVTADHDDAESVMRADCDKRLLRHLHKQVAVKLHARFDEALKDQPDGREKKKHILDWKPATQPQVKPDVADWPSYKSVVLNTSFKKRESAPRPKGTQPKPRKPKRGKDGETIVMPPAPKGGFKKRSAEEEEEEEEDEEEAANNHEASGEVEAVSVKPKAKRKHPDAGSASEGSSSATQHPLTPAGAMPQVSKYPLKNKHAKHVQTWVHNGYVYVAEH